MACHSLLVWALLVSLLPSCLPFLCRWLIPFMLSPPRCLRCLLGQSYPVPSLLKKQAIPILVEFLPIKGHTFRPPGTSSEHCCAQGTEFSCAGPAAAKGFKLLLLMIKLKYERAGLNAFIQLTASRLSKLYTHWKHSVTSSLGKINYFNVIQISFYPSPAVPGREWLWINYSKIILNYIPLIQNWR